MRRLVQPWRRWPLAGAAAPPLVSCHGWFRQCLDQCLDGCGPAFPVGAVGLSGDGLDELLPEWFPVAAERLLDDRCRQREYCALPGCVEGQLAVSAGQVQVRQAQFPGHRRATPIIESRVTSPASSASVMPQSPAGARAGRGSAPRRRSPTPGSGHRRAAGSPSRPATCGVPGPSGPATGGPCTRTAPGCMASAEMAPRGSPPAAFASASACCQHSRNSRS
jgi:hypothetical protein